MNIVILDGARISCVEDMHSVFADSLGFPEYYGRNLDALHDLLGDLNEFTSIIVLKASSLKDALGIRWTPFITMMKKAESENANIHFYLTGV